MANKINIIDATLREGRQSPSVRFTYSQAQEIAQALIELDVDMLELGHPLSSSFDFDLIKAINEQVDIPCLAHARADQADILSAYNTGVSWVGIFIGVNSISSRHKLNKSKDDIFTTIKSSIEYAKQLGLLVRYTVEDASRTEFNDLLKAYQIALDAGADRICFADTVGILEPSQTKEIVSRLVNSLKPAEFEVHLHNDRGLALANALAAVDAGANWISSSVNGLGERCGITDTLTLMANLDFRKNRNYSKELKKLKYTSALVASHSRIFISPQSPVVGDYSFKHTAKLHVDAVKRYDNAYCWRPASDFNSINTLTDATDKLPLSLNELVNVPPVISAEELRYHRKGPGDRYVMIDERFVSNCRQYCIVRDIRHVDNMNKPPSHVDTHRHNCDSLFMFIGNNPDLTGLTVVVTIDDEEKTVHSPSAVFIPAGRRHTYQIIEGNGLFINHVLSGNYNSSLID